MSFGQFCPGSGDPGGSADIGLVLYSKKKKKLIKKKVQINQMKDLTQMEFTWEAEQESGGVDLTHLEHVQVEE